MEKRVKYTGVIANCIMLDNMIELNAALNTLAKEGVIATIDELAALSPYQTRHIKRFGNAEARLPPGFSHCANITNCFTAHFR